MEARIWLPPNSEVSSVFLDEFVENIVECAFDLR